jgi:hypothetical protein
VHIGKPNRGPAGLLTIMYKRQEFLSSKILKYSQILEFLLIFLIIAYKFACYKELIPIKPGKPLKALME